VEEDVAAGKSLNEGISAEEAGFASGRDQSIIESIPRFSPRPTAKKHCILSWSKKGGALRAPISFISLRPVTGLSAVFAGRSFFKERFYVHQTCFESGFSFLG
jgi:hypothetical protein